MKDTKNNRREDTEVSETTFGYVPGEARRGMMQSESDEQLDDVELDESIVRRIVRQELRCHLRNS